MDKKYSIIENKFHNIKPPIGLMIHCIGVEIYYVCSYNSELLTSLLIFKYLSNMDGGREMTCKNNIS